MKSGVLCSKNDTAPKLLRINAAVSSSNSSNPSSKSSSSGITEGSSREGGSREEGSLGVTFIGALGGPTGPTALGTAKCASTAKA